jgi:nicotinate phosphoribosyltransferase
MLDWHDEVVSTFARELPGYFNGTSNVFLAMKHNVKPIGTMAHEFIQAGQGLEKVQLKYSQQYMLEKWIEEYRGDLGIALTDTIGMKPFLKDFDLYLAKLYDGCRHDSSDPYTWCFSLVDHYKKLGIDPRTKSAVFSDNLDFLAAANIYKTFKDMIKISFGIGTNLTNDVGFKPLSIVIKLVKVNGNPVAKISDQPEKVICEDEQFLSYLRKVYEL